MASATASGKRCNLKDGERSQFLVNIVWQNYVEDLKWELQKIIMIGTFLITFCHFMKGSSYKEFELLDVTKVF